MSGFKTFLIIISTVALVFIAYAAIKEYFFYQEQFCPIFTDNDTQFVPCWNLPNCTSINCTQSHYSCGRPACDCRSDSP